MIEVAAAVIKNDFGQILICQRGASGSCANLWEFPGGKREENESLESCLIRECQEELELTIKVVRFILATTHIYPDNIINLSFFEAAIASGTLKTVCHQAVAWIFPYEFREYEFCPADIIMVEQLQAS